MSALNMGYAQLLVTPVMTGFNKTIKKELSSAFPQLGKAAGADFGKGVASGFAGEKKSIESEVKALEKNLVSAQDKLKGAKEANSRASEKETDALKKLEIAELKLNETRESGKAKASQLATAEENVRQKQLALKKAQEDSHRSASTLETATEDLATANDKLKASNDKISDSTKKLDDDFGKTGGVFKRMGDSMKRGFKGVSDSAEKAGKDAGKKASGGFTKNFAVAGAVGGIFGSLTSSLTSSIGDLVSEAFTSSDDTNKFISTMDFAGISEAETKKATASAQKYADETVYDLSTIQGTMAQLASNGIKNYEDLAKASGNLNAVSGGNAETFKSVSMVMTQTAGAGKLTTENFNQIADAIPGASGQIQKALLDAGAYTGNFRDAMKEGEITADEFNDAVLKLGNQPVAVEAAKSTETFEGSIGNLQATIVGGLTSALNGLKPTITGVVNSVSTGIQALIDGIGTFVQWAQDNSSWLLPLVSAIAGMAGAVLLVVGAVKAYTIAQAALNLVMSLSPFGIIVLAIGALVGAFIYLWNNVEGFRNFWITVWGAISGFFITLWEGYLKPAFTAVGTVFGQVITAISGFWTNTLQPVFVAIGSVFKTIWETVLKVAFTALKTYVAVVFAAIKFYWENVLKPVFNALGTFFKWVWETLLRPAFGAVKTGFQNIVNNIKSVWTNVLKPVFNALGTFFKWVWETLLRPAFNSLKTAFRVVVDSISWVWTNLLKPVFNVVGTFMRDTVAPMFQRAIGVIKDAWSSIKGAFKATWTWVAEKVFDPVKTLITETIPNAFKTGVDFIKDAWNKVANIARKPINFVIETVYGGLRNTFNKVADTLGLPDDWRLPEVKAIKEFATGGYTGPGTKYQEAGTVHAGEYVIRKEATSRLRRTIGMDGLDHLNQYGTFPGYAKGGFVRPVNGDRYTGRFGDNRGGLPHAGLDIAVGENTPVHAPLDGTVRVAGWNAVKGRTGIGVLIDHANGISTYQGHLNKALVQAGDIVKANQQIALSGNTGRSSGPHVHSEVWINGNPVNPFDYIDGGIMPTGGDGGGWNPLQDLFDLKDKFVGQFTEKFGSDNMLAQIASGALGNLVNGPIDWIKEKAAAVGDFAKDSFYNVTDWFDGPDSEIQSAVRNVAKGYQWDSGQQWKALSKIISKESGWDPNAKNPNSTAYGLFQMVNGTWDWMGEKRTADPTGQAVAGLKYIQKQYTDPKGAWAHWKKNKSYSSGGLVEPTLYDNGGVLAPGQMQMVSNLTKKPEAIYTNQQNRDLQTLASYAERNLTTPSGDIYNISVPKPAATAEDIVGAVNHQVRINRRGGR